MHARHPGDEAVGTPASSSTPRPLFTGTLRTGRSVGCTTAGDEWWLSGYQPSLTRATPSDHRAGHLARSSAASELMRTDAGDPIHWAIVQYRHTTTRRAATQKLIGGLSHRSSMAPDAPTTVVRHPRGARSRADRRAAAEARSPRPPPRRPRVPAQSVPEGQPDRWPDRRGLLPRRVRPRRRAAGVPRRQPRPGRGEAAGLHEAIGQHGRAWLEAAREVTGDYYEETQADRAADVEGGHPSGTTRECDLCGAEITMGQYPKHLAEGNCGVRTGHSEHPQ